MGHENRYYFGFILYGGKVIAQKTGASANNLEDFMGFGSYETAWAWLHKLRRVMVRLGRDKLAGEVKVDETYIGGKEIGKGQTRPGRKDKNISCCSCRM